MFQEVGDRVGRAWALNHLGRLDQALRKNKAALAFFEDSLKLFYELNVSRGIAWGVVGLASVDPTPGRAALLLGAAQSIFSSHPENIIPSDRLYHEQILAAVRAKSGADEFKIAFSEGQELTFIQVIRYALK